MNTELIITILKWILIAFIMIEAYTAVSVLYDRRNSFSVMTRKSIEIALGKTKSSYFNAKRIEGDLSKYGVMYMLHDYKLDPTGFVAIKICFAGLIALVSFSIVPNTVVAKILAIAVGILIGFFAPDLFIRLNNNMDNEKMSDDIQSIYTTLKIHARAGVYITDSLIECQRNVENGRLKEALNEMNNSILSSRATIDDAVDQFSLRFCNEQINNLSVVIKQALKTGRSSDMLEDISKQIEINNRIHNMKVRDKIKRQSAGIQVAYFSMITVLLLYLVMTELVFSLSGIH